MNLHQSPCAARTCAQTGIPLGGWLAKNRHFTNYPTRFSAGPVRAILT